jgi:hypothetical protein
MALDVVKSASLRTASSFPRRTPSTMKRTEADKNDDGKSDDE